MAFNLKTSPEGIAWRDYRWSHLFWAVPAAILWDFYFLLVRVTRRSSRTLGSLQVPENSILVCVHPDFPVFMAEPRQWIQITQANAEGSSFLGAHHFLSYAPSILSNWLFGIRCIRYDRKSGVRPFDQTLAFLKEHPRTVFAIRTDSGGPYLKVRPSVVEFSRLTGRPLVCFRQLADTRITVNQHQIPLPFTRVNTVIGRVFEADELAIMGPEKALLTLNQEMGSLGKTVQF